jgi:hypothetical protein
MAHEFLKHQLRPISILYVRGVDYAVQDQAQGVDDDMPLPALDFFARVVALGAPFSVVFALWLSTMAALGLISRPSFSRTRFRKAS